MSLAGQSVLSFFSKKEPREAPRRRGVIYKRGSILLVHPVNQTTTGIGLASEPVLQLLATATDAAVGEAVRSALAAWKDGLPHPKVWKGHGKPFLKAAGFRSWRALEDGARYCSISDDGTTLSFEPWEPQETGGGFRGFGAAPESVPSDSPDDIVGAAAFKALSRARS